MPTLDEVQIKISVDDKELGDALDKSGLAVEKFGNRAEAEMRRATREFHHGVEASKGLGGAFDALQGNTEHLGESLMQLSKLPLAMTSPVGALVTVIGTGVVAFEKLSEVTKVSKERLKEIDDEVKSNASGWTAYFNAIASGSSEAEAKLRKLHVEQEEGFKKELGFVEEQRKTLSVSQEEKRKELELIDQYLNKGSALAGIELQAVEIRRQGMSVMDASNKFSIDLSQNTQFYKERQVELNRELLTGKAHLDSLDPAIKKNADGMGEVAHKTEEAANRLKAFNKEMEHTTGHISEKFSHIDLGANMGLGEAANQARTFMLAVGNPGNVIGTSIAASLAAIPKGADLSAQADSYTTAKEALKKLREEEKKAAEERKKEQEQQIELQRRVAEQVGNAVVSMAENHKNASSIIKSLLKELASDAIKYAFTTATAHAVVAGSIAGEGVAEVSGPAAPATAPLAAAATESGIAALIALIPSFEAGGTVPGPAGRPTLVMAHGGEQFAGVNTLPNSGGGKTNVSLTVNAGFFRPSSGAEYDRFLLRLGQDLARVMSL